MASSGGHWIKGIAGPMAGVMVFVPAHPGQTTSFIAGEAILQKADKLGITNVGPSAGGYIDQANKAFGKSPPDDLVKNKVTGVIASATKGPELPKVEPPSPVGDSAYGLSKPTGKIYGAKYTPSPHFNNLTPKTVNVDSSYFSFPGTKPVKVLPGTPVGSGLSIVFFSKTGNYHIVNSAGKPLNTFKSSIAAVSKGIDMADELYKTIKNQTQGQATLW